MKVVLRHQATGRYYRAPREWVRRSDNALTFDDVAAAREFLHTHHLNQAQAVYRLAPYLMSLLHQAPPSTWETWMQAQRSRWGEEPANGFNRN